MGVDESTSSYVDETIGDKVGNNDGIDLFVDSSRVASIGDDVC